MKPRAQTGRKTPRTRKWQLQSAKARFSELFRRARTEGPQHVTRSGKEEVVVIPAEEFERLMARKHQPDNLVDFLRQSPLFGANLDLEREDDFGREIDL